MRRSLVAALLLTTALTPVSARAEPVTAFLVGFSSAAGASAAAAATAQILGGATLLGFQVGTFAATTVGGALLRLGLAAGLSLIAQNLTPRPSRPSPSDRMVNFAQPITLMEWVVGRVRKGGPYAITSFQEDRRHYGVILAAHEITSIEQWYVDNQPVDVVDGLVTTPPFNPYVGLRPYLGAPGQTADSVMMAAIPEWTSAHNMAGLAWVAAFARRAPDDKVTEVYGNSAETGPVITPVIRGVKVYDPRTETTGYSNNAALVEAWIRQNRLGEDSVDWDEVAVEADVADTIVTNRDGGSQPKWVLNGSFSDDATYAELVEQIIAACDGYVYEKPDGSVGFKVGGYTAPDITLTEADFYQFDLAENDFGQDPVTEWVAQYVEPANNYLEAISGTWQVDADSNTNRQTVQILMADSHNQAIRCLKRMARAARPQFTLSGLIGPIALDLLEKRFVAVEVLGREFNAEIVSVRPGEDDVTFQIELASVEAEDFAFVAADEEPEPPARDEVTNDDTVPAPDGLTGTATSGSQIIWAWNPQREDLNQEFRIREVGATEWRPAILITDGTNFIPIPALTDGETYEAELSNITTARRRSAWVPFGNVEAVANATPPEPVEDFAATGGVGQVDLVWVSPNDPNYAGVRIYRAVDSTDFADATLLLTTFGGPNVTQAYANTSLAPDTYVYWAASINGSGIESTLVGPESATVT